MSEADDHMNTPPDARIGFRDIYRAVGESEARITARINEAFTALSKDASDHEARLRTIESIVSPALTEARDLRIANVEAQAAENARILANQQAISTGVFATLGAGRQIIVLGAAIIGGIVAAADLISRIA